MCMARGGLLEGDKNDKDLEEPGKETRTGKDLEEGTGRPWKVDPARPAPRLKPRAAEWWALDLNGGRLI